MNTIYKRRITSVSCIALIIGGLLPSCGPYSFSGSGLPGHIKIIAVPLVEDRTPEFAVNEQLTDAIINEITRDNTLKIGNEAGADAIVIGTIISLEDRADTYTSQEQVESYRVYVTVEFEVQDRKKNSSLWKEKWSQWGLYKLSDGPTREEGIETAVGKIAEDILNKTVSGW
jgi:hypothetical protein